MAQIETIKEWFRHNSPIRTPKLGRIVGETKAVGIGLDNRNAWRAPYEISRTDTCHVGDRSHRRRQDEPSEKGSAMLKAVVHVNYDN